MENLVINCIRTLAMDAVEKAKSGHPGTPMALAPAAFVLFDGFLKHNPSNPQWPNRDRFVLSAGHASMLLYATLYVNGYDISIDDLKQFRSLHSRCPGHPEIGITSGVETTTGPLGQGVSNSVGMAIAGKWLSEHFNRPGYNIVNHHVYSICSDGDMMEGISSEAASIAGHLGLGNLIWIYDSNSITIEGSTLLAYSEDTEMRFGSYNWHVEKVSDVNNLEEIEKAIARSRSETEKPSIIIMKSQIAYGSPNKQNTCEAHGAPLGKEEVSLAKEFYGWDAQKNFHVPDEVLSYREAITARGNDAEAAWKENFRKYSNEYPELAREFEMLEKRELPEDWDSNIPSFPYLADPVATRSANSNVINAIGKKVPWFMGGAADVGSSTKTYLKNTRSFSAEDHEGRNFHFGVREHSMAAIASGMCLSGLRAYASTYFVFADYMKPSIRLAALMKLPVIYIFTHDSIGVGEDGPTHQPIEHLASLRVTPNIDVIRPCDANELAVLWKHVMELTDRPAAFVLTRQNVPVIDRERYAAAEEALQGGYVLADSDGTPDIIMISTGSEVHICLEVYEKLSEMGKNPRVVSLPCWNLFEAQPQEYRDSVLPPSGSTRLSVEAAATFRWEKFTGSGPGSKAYGIDCFGESAPYRDVMNKFGFNTDTILGECLRLLGD
ncbi:MAG: transketolase [Candidatus Dadabacteria bacterium]|nr:transketolase [Candidatus Dadabacteria bacterium]